MICGVEAQHLFVEGGRPWRGRRISPAAMFGMVSGEIGPKDRQNHFPLDLDVHPAELEEFRAFKTRPPRSSRMRRNGPVADQSSAL
ncbi:hypothetical protein ACH4LT_11355 [Streptomyces clavifer]|uniref:hypothetical protein n=1 Tax=Streptomyces clavifer TaxID=68188 RepID=UPI00378920A5